MKTPISAWIDYASDVSPDGESVARYDEAMEVAMGAPTMGTLVVIRRGREHVVSARAGASMVWSDDSRLLAFSEWTQSMMQNLCVYCVADGSVKRNPEEFRVLELHAFSDGRISGVDSPIHMPRTFSLAYKNEAESGRNGD